MKKEQIDGIWYWVSDHYPAKPYNKVLIGSEENPITTRPYISAGEFWERHTEDEQDEIVELAQTNRKARWLLQHIKIAARANLGIYLLSQKLQGLYALAESAGKIGPGRAAKILSVS